MKLLKQSLQKLLLITVIVVSTPAFGQSQDSIQVTIADSLFWSQPNETIHLRVTDSITQQVWYDTVALVSPTTGFHDTLYLDSGLYICDVLSIGAAVQMPYIKLDNGYIVPWGYPAYEFYLFRVPGNMTAVEKVNTRSRIHIYPNPAEDQITVTLPDDAPYLVTLLNVNGKALHRQTSSRTARATLDVKELPPGIYLVQVAGSHSRSVSRFIKK